MTLGCYGVMTLWRCDVMALWVMGYGVMALWVMGYGVMALWRCDVMG
jgi:hypothetical protein